VTQLSPIIESLVKAIDTHCDIPFAFFGHCLGALMAFELARKLSATQRMGLRYLFAAACRAPQLPMTSKAVHELPDREFVERLRELDQTPTEILENAELLSLFMPVLRADLSVWETYIYSNGEPLQCAISVFGGADDEELRPDALAPWEAQTQNSFTSRILPGGHFFLHSARHLLLRFVNEDLTRAMRPK
jgi:medium-chain acyl-[acyl-carrier-protein] hydrolase